MPLKRKSFHQSWTGSKANPDSIPLLKNKHFDNTSIEVEGMLNKTYSEPYYVSRGSRHVSRGSRHVSRGAGTYPGEQARIQGSRHVSRAAGTYLGQQACIQGSRHVSRGSRHVSRGAGTYPGEQARI